MPPWGATNRLGRIWQPYERLSNLVFQSQRKLSRPILERFLPLIVLALFTILVLSLFFTLRGNTFRRSTPQDLGHHNLGRRDAIKSAFEFAWDGYHAFAFPHDELKPSSNLPGKSRNDWGATAVDALGTAILMETPEVVKTILAHVKSIDFHNTSSPISVFESTIRYMGGLLSAYELLTGPFASPSLNPASIYFLVDQAKTLGDVLSAAFVNGNPLPSGELDPHTLKGNGANSLAGAGTLVSNPP
jgi:hypothetical protein